MNRSLGVLVAVSALSLILGLYLSLSGSGETLFNNGANSFSRSLLGHSGLVDLLRDLDVPVHVGRTPPGAELPADMMTLVAEPRFDGGERREGAAEEAWREYDSFAWNLLLVLPAWEAVADPFRPAWVAGRDRVPPRAHERLLEVIGLPAEIVHADSMAATGWHLPDGLPAPELPAPQLLELDAAAAAEGEIEPLWWCDAGVLLARWRRYERETFYILADPDLLNNGGLGRGENARLVLSLVDDLTPGDGAVVVDETLHGFSRASSPTSALLRPPLVWVVLHLLLLAAGLLWLANGRLGTPPSPLRARRDGKAFLIANTASLLLVGRHHEHLLRRYLNQTVREIARARQVAATGSRERVVARLDRLPGAGSPRPSERCASLAARSTSVGTEAELARVATEIHAWKLEMLHGTHRPARNRRPAA